MQRRKRRQWFVVLAVVGLWAANAVPASAHSSGLFTVLGNAALNAGLDFPCPATTQKCTVPNVVPGGVGKKQPPFIVTNGNTRTGTFGSTICAGKVTNAPDKNKPTTEAPGCGMAFTFTITGFCGLASGSGSGTITTAAGHTRWFNVTFSDKAGVFLMRGNWWKTGPTKPPTPEGDIVVKGSWVATQGSCLNKTATGFTATLKVKLFHPKLVTI